VPIDLRVSCSPELELLDPDRPVVFVHINSKDAVSNGSRLNVAEAEVVIRIVEELLRCGVEEGSIGVISPFKAQRGLIIGMLRRLNIKGVEVDTVDAFQGREKDVVVFDVTSTSSFGFSTDAHRLNIALTRARLKLVVVGNAEAIQRRAENTLLHKFLEYCSKKNAVYDWSRKIWINLRR